MARARDLVVVRVERASTGRVDVLVNEGAAQRTRTERSLTTANHGISLRAFKSGRGEGTDDACPRPRHSQLPAPCSAPSHTTNLPNRLSSMLPENVLTTEKALGRPGHLLLVVESDLSVLVPAYRPDHRPPPSSSPNERERHYWYTEGGKVFKAIGKANAPNLRYVYTSHGFDDS